MPDNAAIFKALGDPNRLQIFEMLSCCELCACDILEQFHITQPTLSHHMKILCGCGLVRARRDGKCTYYALDIAKLIQLQDFFGAIIAKECQCGTDCNCMHCTHKRKEVNPMAERTCTNPHCQCVNCTCDPCLCTPENPCGCEGCEVK